MKVVLEKRLEQSLKAQIGLPVLSALMALVFCGVFFALTGKDPFLVYESMFSGALGNDYRLQHMQMHAGGQRLRKIDHLLCAT